MKIKLPFQSKGLKCQGPPLELADYTRRHSSARINAHVVGSRVDILCDHMVRVVRFLFGIFHSQWQGIRTKALICTYMLWANGKGEFFRVENKTLIWRCEWIISARASYTLLRFFRSATPKRFPRFTFVYVFIDVSVRDYTHDMTSSPPPSPIVARPAQHFPARINQTLELERKTISFRINTTVTFGAESPHLGVFSCTILLVVEINDYP